MGKSLEELKKELDQEQIDKVTAEEIAQRGKEAEKGLKEKRIAIAEKQKELVKIGTNHERAIIKVANAILNEGGKGLQYLSIQISVHDVDALKADLKRQDSDMPQSIGAKGGAILINAKDLGDGDLTMLHEVINAVDHITTDRQKTIMGQVTKRNGKSLSEFKNADPFYTKVEG